MLLVHVSVIRKNQGKQKRMATRILLRSRADGRFVSGALTWSARSQEAREFPSALAADGFVREHRLKRMEMIVFREKAPPWRVRLDKRGER